MSDQLGVPAKSRNDFAGVNNFKAVCIRYTMKNNLTVHRTDERMYFLQKLLSGAKFERDVHVFAPNVALDDEKLAEVANGGLVICGKCADVVRNSAKKRGIDVFEMMRDEKFLAVNSRLTAEGALMLMLEHSLLSISDAHVLVMGFGRMGAAVVNLLGKLGVRMSVATNGSSRPAYAFAQSVIPLENFDFAPYDVIINTVPYPIVKDAELLTMRETAVYIDLASSPAVNLEYAKYLGLDADIYPALPAKVCPLGAAVAMKDYISEVTK